METLEQRCSQLAWEKLTSKNRFGDQPGNWQEKAAPEYLGALKKTPARIHTSGLGQALAFLRSRGEKAASWVEEDLSELTLHLLGMGNGNLLALLRGGDATFLFLATDEVMRVINWLTRYLEGAGVKSKHGEDEEDDALPEVIIQDGE